MQRWATQVVAILIYCVFTADAQTGRAVVLISDDSTLPGGDTAVLTCVAYNPSNEMITWTRDGQPIMDSPVVMIYQRDVVGYTNFKQSLLQICSLGLSDAGNYTCAVGAANATVQLTVFSSAVVVAISNDISLTMGQTAMLSCVGFGDPDVEISWSFNGAPVVNTSLTTIYKQDTIRGGTVFKQSFLQLCSATVSTVGSYTCIVSNRRMITNSTTQVTGGIAEIVGISTDTISDVGQTTLFTCVGFGEPDAEISWSFNGAPVANTSLVTSYEEDTIRGGRNFKQSFLQLCSLTVSDAGVYTCTARNGLTIVDATTQLSGGPAEIVAISTETSADVGGTALLTCLGFAESGVEISWSFNEAPLVNTSLVAIYERDVVKGGRLLKQSFLQLCGLTVTNGGVYTCLTRSGLTVVSATTLLTGGAAEIVAISSDVTSNVGATAMLTCVGVGERAVQVGWSFNGVSLGNSSLVTIYERDIVRGGSIFKQSFLQLCSLTLSNAGGYNCNVMSGLTVVSATAQITGGVAAIIAASNDASSNAGQSALLTCVGFGQFDVEISWSFNGAPVANTSLITISERNVVKGGSVFKQSFLQLCSVTASNAGAYTCILSSGLSTTNATTQLTVNEAEVVAISDDLTLEVGQTAFLVCVGTGEPDVDVTWSFNGAPFASSSLATIHEGSVVKGGRVYRRSILQLCGLAMSDTGNYTCVVSGGQVTASETTQLIAVGPVAVEVISNNILLSVGASTVLVCVGFGEPSVETSWIFNGAPVVNTPLTTVNEMDFIRGGRVRKLSFLQICSVSASDDGNYICIANNGQATRNATTQLMVDVGEVEVVLLSNDTTVDPGQSTVLTCVGFGDPRVEISWSLNGAPVVNTSLIDIQEEDFTRGGRYYKQSSLQLCGITASLAGDYTCIINNSLITANATTQLMVIVGPLDIVLLSDDVAVDPDFTTLLTCVGFGEPELEISWSYNGAPIVNTSLTAISERSFISGGRLHKQSYLQLCSIGIYDGGNYTCIADNGHITVNATTQLTVIVGAVGVAVLSNDTALDAGESTVLTCVGFGEPGVEIIWRLNGYPVLNNSLVMFYEDYFISGGLFFQRSFLQLCSPTVLANGVYMCTADNGLVTANATTQLTVTAGAVAVVLLSSNSSLKEGQSTVLTCVGFGEPDVELSWSFNGTPVVNTSLTTVIDGSNVHREVLYRQSFLQLCAPATSDTDYTCIANNGHANATAVTQVRVTPYAVEIAAISDDTTVGGGGTAVLACLGVGELDVEIGWSFNGAPIRNTSVSVLYEEEYLRGGRIYKHSFVELCGISTSAFGEYTCTIRNSRRSASSTVQLIRGVTNAPVSVISTGEQVSLDIGGSTSFECRAIGFPLPTIDWYKDGDLITASRANFRITSRTEIQGGAEMVETSVSTLEISDISPGDAGMYTCRATNTFSTDTLGVAYSLTVRPTTSCSRNPCQNGGRCSVSSTCFLCECADGFTGITCASAATTNTAPMLTTGPETGYAPLFGIASFNCVASGSPQPRIQWFRNGSPLDGEMCPVLMVNGVSLSDRGFYHCTATNTQGTVTSPAAALHVNDTRQITVPVLITKPGSGPFQGLEDLTSMLSGERMDDINQFITIMSTRAGGTQVTGTNSPPILVYRIQPVDGPISLIPAAVENGAILNLVVTLYAPTGTLVVTPEVRNNTEELMERIAMQLGVPNFNVQIEDSVIFDGCPETTETLVVGGMRIDDLQWTEIAIGERAAVDCPCPQVTISRQAYRVCGGDFITGGRWNESEVTECEFDVLALELCSAVDVGVVNRLLSNNTRMNTPETVALATGIAENNVAAALGNTSGSDFLFDLIDNILKAPPDSLKDSHEEFNSSGRLLDVIDQLTESYPIQQVPTCVSRDAFGCCLYPAIGNEALSFSPQIGATIQLQGSTNPSLNITLPASLSSAISNQPGVSFCAYKDGSLFIRRDSYLMESGQTSTMLASHVIGAKLHMGVTARNLQDPNRITFSKTQNGSRIICSYWNQSLDDGYGAWSSEGCRLVADSEKEATCECNHLTNFGILVDTSETPVSNEESIGRYTIIGALFVIMCAAFVILNTIIAQCRFKEAMPEVVIFLINLCIAFLCLNISYIISSFVDGSETTCKAFSFIFHYFLLVSCAALASMAFFTGVIPPFDGKKKLMYLGPIAAGWIFPIIIVGICYGLDSENYLSQELSPFCGPVSEPYWYGLLLIGGIFLVFTAVILVLTPIVRAKSSSATKSTKPRWNTDYIGIFSIGIFFYLAWGFGLPSVHPLNIGDVRVLFQVIFIVSSCLLGVLIVILSMVLYNPCRKSQYPFGASHTVNENVHNDNVFMMEKKEDEDNISFTLPDYNDLQYQLQGNEGGDDEDAKEDLGDMLARAEF